MAYRSTRLPSRFPVGTKFVIESEHRGKGKAPVYSRYVEFPDGTLLPLPPRTAPAKGKSVPAKAKVTSAPRRRGRRLGPRPN